MNKGLLSVTFFASMALAGCATMNQLDRDSCMERDQKQFLLFVSQSDSFNRQCATAQAARVISQMKRSDGTPDPAAQATALQLYRESNPAIKKYIEEMLAQDGKKIEELERSVSRTQCTSEEINVNGRKALKFTCK